MTAGSTLPADWVMTITQPNAAAVPETNSAGDGEFSIPLMDLTASIIEF